MSFNAQTHVTTTSSSSSSSSSSGAPEFADLANGGFTMFLSHIPEGERETAAKKFQEIVVAQANKAVATHLAAVRALAPPVSQIGDTAAAVSTASAAHCAAVTSLRSLFTNLGVPGMAESIDHLGQQDQLLGSGDSKLTQDAPQSVKTPQFAYALVYNPYIDPWTVLPIFSASPPPPSASALAAANNGNNSTLALATVRTERVAKTREANGVPTNESLPGSKLTLSGWILALANLNALLLWCQQRIKIQLTSTDQQARASAEAANREIREITTQNTQLSLLVQRLTCSQAPATEVQQALAQTWSLAGSTVQCYRQSGLPPQIPEFSCTSATSALSPVLVELGRRFLLSSTASSHKFLAHDHSASGNNNNNYNNHNNKSDDDSGHSRALKRSIADVSRAPRARRPAGHGTQLDSLQAFMGELSADDKKRVELELCPECLGHGNCPADSPDECEDWHVCYHCLRRGKALKTCVSHTPIQCNDKIGRGGHNPKQAKPSSGSKKH